MTPRPPCRSGSSDYWTASAKLGEAGSTPAHQLEHRDFGGRCHAFATDGGAWIFDIARGLAIILVGHLAVLSVQVHPFHRANAAAALQPDYLAAAGLEMLMSIDARSRASQRDWFAAHQPARQALSTAVEFQASVALQKEATSLARRSFAARPRSGRAAKWRHQDGSGLNEFVRLSSGGGGPILLRFGEYTAAIGRWPASDHHRTRHRG